MCVSTVLQMDFMNAIHKPLSESQGLNYTMGKDGYPAFAFNAKSDVQLSDEHFYLPLWSDFSLFAIVKPLQPQGGFLFAIVSPSGALVQFGLRVADRGSDSSKVQLYYTDYRGWPSESAVIAEFGVSPPLAGSWNRLTMKVKDDRVTLLVECSPQGTVTVPNRVRDLTFQDGSTFYLAQAGPEFTDAKFEVGTFLT